MTEAKAEVLYKPEVTQTAAARRSVPVQSLARIDPQALISEAIAAGAGIETLERLVALATAVREATAKEAWFTAMADFQRRCPTIKKTQTARIRTRTGPGFMYRFAPLDEILAVMQPILGDLGLSVSWSSRFEGDRVIVECFIAHVLGHREGSGEIPIPIGPSGDGESGATPQQRVGIATTYGRRYSLLSITGQAPEDDDDATAAQQPEVKPGETAVPDLTPITEHEVRKFFAIARGHGWTDDERHTLLTSLGVNKVEEIPAAKFESVLTKLKAREAKLS